MTSMRRRGAWTGSGAAPETRTIWEILFLTETWMEVASPSTFSTSPGRRIVNVEPLPGSLFTLTSPPIISQNFREMARPEAGPAVLAAGACASACVNAWKSLPSCSGVMPIPVSRTRNETQVPAWTSFRRHVESDGPVLGELGGVAKAG